MRIAIAGLSHETQTSLPGTTELESFTRGARRGAEMMQRYKERPNSALGRAASVFDESGVQVEPLVYASGGVGPTVVDEVYEQFAGEICTGLKKAQPLDGIFLALHGAMVTQNRQDPELDLVREVRETVGDDIPIIVTLDLHGNLSPEMVEVTTGLFGYRCSPHVDVGDTGERAARAMMKVLRGEVDPTSCMKKPGLVVPSLYSATTQWPGRDIQKRVLHWDEHPEVVDVSFFFGFAWADVSQLGVSAVVITDDNPQLAEEIADDLAELAWSHREPLTRQDNLHSVRDGVSLAMEKAETAEKPIIILDHADRMQDTTFVLRELLRQGAEGAAHPLLYDPEAAEACRCAGAGSEVEICVGSNSSERAGGAVPLRGTVKWVGEMEYVATGPMRRGRRASHGLTAIVDADGVWVQLTSRRASLIDTDPIDRYGWRPEDFTIIVTKSKTHFRAVYEDVGEEIIVVDAPQYSPVDLSGQNYSNATPDLYPLKRYD